MAVTSSEAFLKVLKKSGLLSEEEFDEVHQKYGGEDDPKGIARTLIKVGKINKWQALQLLSGRHALTLSKYKLLDQIGSDQSTRTYLAEHAQMGRRVAIKTLSRRQATEAPELTKRFVDQATKLAALDHRNIIHAYDVDSGDDRLYVVLEHVEGLSLKQMLDEQGAMPAEKVAHYVSQTAAGLAYAHKHGHTHGDIRPANLLVDNQDVVKIANLGVGGLTTSEQDDGSEAASTAYVAPEQSADEASGDHRSDIYSLGCVMYALLTGHPPASDGSGPPSVLDERPDVHRLLATICGRMMAHDANDRYQAAGDIEQQLDQWLKLVADAKPASSHSQAASEGEPADAASDSQPPKAAAPPPRKRVQDKKAPEQKKPSPAPEEPQVVADSPAKPKRTAASTKPAAASAKPGEPGKAKKDAEAKAKPGVAVAAASGVPAADSAAKPQEPAPADAASKKPAGAAAKESKLPGMPEIPVTEAKPSSGAAGGVAINTKGNRRRKKGKPGKAGAVAAADGAESGSKTAYIIGGAIAGGAVLVGGVILLIVLFSGGDEDDIELVGPVFREVAQEYPDLDRSRTIHEAVRRLIEAMVNDVIDETRRRLAETKPNSAADVRHQPVPIVAFSEDMAAKEKALKEFLFENMYRHDKVNRMMDKGRGIVGELFDLYLKDPGSLPDDWRDQTDDAGSTVTARVVCDFIAGMTDRYALEEHDRLFQENSGI